MIERTHETIVAISSPPGHSQVGIVRLSGPQAIDIAQQLTSQNLDTPLEKIPGSRRIDANLLLDDDLQLPATLYLFRQPHSYTRQDLVEIYAPGSPPLLDMITNHAVSLGARHAEPGEFTARAFFSGAKTLEESEAVAGIIRAESDVQLRAARKLADGSATKQVLAVRQQIAELLALIEADIDFAEESIDFITPTQLKTRLHNARLELDKQMQDAQAVEQFDNLPRILLFGSPNVGKSSLMNRLSGISRSICAAVAGTTRDILAAPIKLGRSEAILLDSAGVDQSIDTIAEAAKTMTLSQAQRVDAICLVIDITQPVDSHVIDLVQQLDMGNIVIAANKCDLMSGETSALRDTQQSLQRLGLNVFLNNSETVKDDSHADAIPLCPISAVTGQGIELLQSALLDALSSTTTTTLTQAILLSERQRVGINQASESIVRAIALCQSAKETIDCADLLAFELREALEHLGTVTGDITTEDLLSQIFAKFCIGK